MALSPLSVKRFRVIFSIGWMIILADLILVLKWFGFTWVIAIVDGGISTFILLMLSLLIMNTLRFYTPRKEQYIHLVAWCIFLAAIWLLLSRWLLLISLGRYQGYAHFLKDSLPIRGSIGFLLLGCVALLSVVWFSLEDQKETERRQADAERLAREAELFKLRQQLQPHFLFNSLNSINALIGLRPAEARKMVQQLSDFLRGTLKKEEHQWVSLHEELQYLQLYLDIEKVRFANRLATMIDCEEGTDQMKLPALLLQPIVENAIKFGLYDTMGEATISITAKKENNDLVIRVENPFDPETSAAGAGTGFGLTSVKRRLYLLFARNDLLSTAANNTIFITVVKIPQYE
jgi:two-component system LytT family sensor kinase